MKKTELLYILFLLVIIKYSNAQNDFTLLDSSHLEYVGSFNVPQISDDSGSTFAWAGSGLAYNQTNNSLFITGHDHFQLVGEISIPDPAISNSTTDLPLSELLQPLVDITEGHISEIGEGGASLSNNNHNMKIGGLLVQENSLIGSSYPYYESATEEKRSHFKRSVNLDTMGTFQGMYTIGNNIPGLVSGYMGAIPSDWQSTFEASAITGNACIPIISRSSFGPSVSTFSPESLGASIMASSTSLLYYPEEHPTLGDYSNETVANPVYCMSTKINGVVFPEKSKTILFFGRTGLGIPEYGAGTDDITLDGTKVDGFDEYYVYDPANPLSKGTHAWPYASYVWAYDIEDLIEVKEGLKNPWEVVPYKHWQLNIPYTDSTSNCLLGGAAYDPDRNWVFISHLRAHRERPVIHVYKVNINTPIHQKAYLQNQDRFFSKLKLLNSKFYFNTSTIMADKYAIRLILANGKIIDSKNIFLESDCHYIIDFQSLSGSGIYFIDIANSNEKIVYRRTLIKH